MPIRRNKARIVANGEDLVIFTGIPEGCLLRMDGTIHSEPITDGVFEYATNIPETGEFRFVRFPYLDWTGEVTAVAPDPHSNEG
jgi:hypothetical protein